MGTEKNRIHITELISNSVIASWDQGVSVNRTMFEAELAITFGLTKKKAGEYIELMLDARRIKEIDGELYPFKEKEAVQASNGSTDAS